MDLLHWAMWGVVYRLIAMAIEMACGGGTFAHHRRLLLGVIVAKDHGIVHLN